MADSGAGAGVPTFGGRQFWGDLSFFQGWKIQRNVFTGHCRVLDPSGFRHVSASDTECSNWLYSLMQQLKLKPDQGKAVILIHGIGRSSRCFSHFIGPLHVDGYVVVPFEYPSTRISLEHSAEYLRSVIESLTGADRIDFVTHSMGGLVVRRLLADFADRRLHSLVMLGTPNHGAELADMLHQFLLFRLVYGPAGRQLVTGSDEAIEQLPIPAIAFGIIAGGRGDEKGFNPLLPGDNDGTVTVASTRLEGAADMMVVPRMHTFLMSDETVIQATRCFLRCGCFTREGR